jgi:hypothetical protein
MEGEPVIQISAAPIITESPLKRPSQQKTNSLIVRKTVTNSRSKRKASSGDFTEENPMQNENLQFLHSFDKGHCIEQQSTTFDNNNINKRSS